MTSVYDLVAAQAERVPEATAVIVGDRRTSYRELNSLAAGYARRLTEPSGSLVGVCLGRDERLVAGLLAVWRAGCGYVPLDPVLPMARLEGMVRQAGLRQVLTTRDLAPTVSATGAQPVLIDDPDGGEETPARAGGDVAYVLFTSGSTGTPKGVIIEHSSVVAFLRWVERTSDPAHLRAGLATASLSFDASVHQIFGPLSTGGSVVLADNILALPTLPARDEVTMIGAPPSAIAALLEQPLPSGVRRVNVGGEVATRSLVDRLYAQPGVETVVNVYGPTECTVFCATHVIGRAENGNPPIGQPVAGSELTVRDADQRVVDDGTPGELWVAGPLVGRGYLGAPELTAERFVEDPASLGARRYRTGDLVRRVDGVLHYLGRLDDQVKVRGFRVEFGEVESALAAYPGVRNAVATAPADPQGVRTLHAYVEAPAGTAPVTEAELHDHLRDRLPDYMVPARIMVLENLPLNSSGKADRAALPPIPLADGTVGESTYEAPRSATEEQVAAIVAAVLDLPRVGRRDRFDELGGHSLTAARVVARIRTELGAAVSMEGFLADPTVAGLARRVADGQSTALPVLTRGTSQDIVEPTDMQREFWTMGELAGVAGVTVEAFRLRMSGRFSTAQLADALHRIVTRHPALRTAFEERDGRVVGVVRPPTPVPLTERDVQHLDPESREQIVNEAARRPLVLDGTVPLLRGDLLRTGKDTAELVITVDHLGFDGWSGGILIEELAGELGSVASTVPEPAVQLGDIARWERDLFAVTTAANSEFWRTELVGAQPPYALSRRPRAAAPAYRGARLVRPLAPELSAALRDVCAADGMSEFSGYLAALDLLLGRWTDSTDVLIGVPAARRDLPELDRVIGPLISMLPVRLRWSPEQTFRSLVGLAAIATGRSLAHADLPVAELAGAAAAVAARRPQGVQLTPVVLSVRPIGASVRAARGGILVESLGELDTGFSQNEATFMVNRTAEGEQVQFCYDIDRYDEAGAAAMLDGFLQVLAAVTAEPDLPCSAVPVPELPGGEPAAPAPVAETTAAPAASYVEPTTVVEQFLAECWQRLLGRERVSLTDSLFDLGGNSLIAMNVISEIREALGVKMPLRTVFELSVLADLSAEVERRALALLDAEVDA
ncbi:amino acid adenylation domain-containing protein [Streptomyces sp. NPDC048448]|uniref:amino acid adenylation domain-containing protein n=1 Tax=Streptomyces sp. NPDC048448 TaxID=3365554 RepID=UPI00372028C1